MAWLASNVLRNIFSSINPPNKVLEVRHDKYSNRNVICREESIVFYGPDEVEKKCEIVIHRTDSEHVYR